METHKKWGRCDYSLDTGGVCFLCLKLSSGVDIASKNGIKCSKKSSLFKISRFLQIDIHQMYPEIFTTSKLDKGKNEIFVSLCDSCLSVYNLFDELYNILEETELLMKGCINKIHHVIQDGQKDPIRMEEMKRRPSVMEEDAKIIESLRKIIMLECERNLKLSFPRVKLSRLCDDEIKQWEIKQTNQSTSSPIVTKCEPIEVNDTLMEEDSSPTIEWNDETSYSYPDTMDLPPTDIEFNLNQCTSASTSTSTSQSDSNKFELSTSSKIVTCPYCQFKVSWRRRGNLDTHLGTNHVEHFFPNLFHRLEMPLLEFQTFIKFKIEHFIEKDNCSLCSKKYKISVRPQQLHHVKAHMLNEHGPELEKYLMESLSLANVPEPEPEKVNEVILEGESFPSWNKMGVDGSVLKCPHCTYTTTQRRAMRLHHHIGTNHPEHYFPDVIQKLGIQDENLKKLVNCGVKNLIKENNCALCHLKYNLKKESEQYRHVKVHLLLKHRKELEEKIMEIGRSPKLFGALTFNFEVKSSSVNYTAEVNDPLEEQEDDPKLVKDVVQTRQKVSHSRLICQHCGKKFSRPTSVRHHILVQHKEIYFPSMKRDNVTDFQFKLIVDHLIFNDFIKDFSCTLCSKKNTSVNIQWQLIEIKSHLINKHREKLVEKLMKIQNDREIMSQVAKASLACQCGQLFLRKSDMLKHSISCNVQMALRGKQIPCLDCGNKIFRKNMMKHKEKYCRMRKVAKVMKSKLDFPKGQKRAKCDKLVDSHLLSKRTDTSPGKKRSRSRSESKMDVDT